MKKLVAFDTSYVISARKRELEAGNYPEKRFPKDQYRWTCSDVVSEELCHPDIDKTPDKKHLDPQREHFVNSIDMMFLTLGELLWQEFHNGSNTSIQMRELICQKGAKIVARIKDFFKNPKADISPEMRQWNDYRTMIMTEVQDGVKFMAHRAWLTLQWTEDTLALRDMPPPFPPVLRKKVTDWKQEYPLINLVRRLYIDGVPKEFMGWSEKENSINDLRISLGAIIYADEFVSCDEIQIRILKQFAPEYQSKCIYIPQNNKK